MILLQSHVKDWRGVFSNASDCVTWLFLVFLICSCGRDESVEFSSQLNTVQSSAVTRVALLSEIESAEQGGVTSVAAFNDGVVINAKWDLYVSDVKIMLGSLQEDCEPVRLNHQPGTERKGTIILLHGFSPCPQQFYDLAKILNSKGYDVLLPLLPGHGLAVKPGHHDDYSKLPTLNDWQRYQDFAKQMNEIMELEPGTRAMGGLSVGGAIAARAAQFASDNLYARLILLSPYFGHARAEVRLMLGGLRKSWAVPALRSLVLKAGESYTGWGQECVQERNLGRAGYCDFVLNNGLAIEELGDAAWNEIEKISVPTQFVRVEADTGASFSMMSEAVKQIERRGFLAGDAVYPRNAGVNHSLLSRFDSPSEEKYWISSLEQAVAGFLADGSPIGIEDLEVRLGDR